MFSWQNCLQLFSSRRRPVSELNVLRRFFFLKPLDPTVLTSIYQALETHLQVRDSITTSHVELSNENVMSLYIFFNNNVLSPNNKILIIS